MFSDFDFTGLNGKIEWLTYSTYVYGTCLRYMIHTHLSLQQRNSTIIERLILTYNNTYHEDHVQVSNIMPPHALRHSVRRGRF